MGEASDKPRVEDYMTREVATVSPDDTVAAVARRVAETEEHSGLPVCEGRNCIGFVSARDLLLADDDALVFTVMSDDLVVAHPEMALSDAARVILRSGIQKLPVVDDAGNLIGIIANTDVVRSQIERATPEKVGKLSRTLENIHGVTTSEERRRVALDSLTPTQSKVYGDELEGRSYELDHGLTEPLVVIDNSAERNRSRDGEAVSRDERGTGGSTDHASGRSPRADDENRQRRFSNHSADRSSGQRGGETASKEAASPSPGPREDGSEKLLLADGHHRVKAAAQSGIEEMDAYVIVVDERVELGMAETARNEGLSTIDDICVVDYAHHPLIESVERLQNHE